MAGGGVRKAGGLGRKLLLALGTGIVAALLALLAANPPEDSGEAAAWVQAIGSVGAILVAAVIAGAQKAESLRREARDRAEHASAAQQQAKANRAAALGIGVMIRSAIESMTAIAERSGDPKTAFGPMGRGPLESAAAAFERFPLEVLGDEAVISDFMRIGNCLVITRAHAVELERVLGSSSFAQVSLPGAMADALQRLRESRDLVDDILTEMRGRSLGPLAERDG